MYFPPVLSLLVLGFLISSCHLGFVGSLSSRADFDGRVLKRGCRDGHFSTTLSDDQAIETFLTFRKRYLYKNTLSCVYEVRSQKVSTKILLPHVRSQNF